MIFTFGKHNGRSVEEVILRDANYIAWILNQKQPRGSFAQACERARQLIAIFNSKPFLLKCCSSVCSATATLATACIRPYTTVMFWCDDCSPVGSEVNAGKFQQVVTYNDAVFHVSSWWGGGEEGYQSLIRDLAQAKGLPPQARAKQIQAFFGS